MEQDLQIINYDCVQTLDAEPERRPNHWSLPPHPFRIAMIGASMVSGKTNCLVHMLDKRVCCDTLHVITPQQDQHKYQLLHDLAKVSEGIVFYDCVKDFDLSSLEREKTNLVVFDDVMQATNPKDMPKVVEVFSRGRHYGASVLLLVQSFFNGIPITVRGNCSHLMLFRVCDPRDLKRIYTAVLGGMMPLKEFEKLYHEITSTPYSFMFIDLYAKDPRLRIRNNFDGYML